MDPRAAAGSASLVGGRIAALAVTLAVALAPAPASGQTIRGLLLERGTDRPIDLGEITMLDASGDTVGTALTDENGLFSITARDGGSYRLVARALGYRAQGGGPYEVDDGGMLVVQLMLETQPVDIEGIDVEAEALFPEEESVWLDRQGFYERRKVGIGHFFTPADIEREDAIITYTAELIGRLPGAHLTPSGRGVRLGSTTGGHCWPALFVDGVRVQVMFGGYLDDVAPMEALEGVEVYTRPAQVPLQYSWAASGCGLILFWTKH